MAFQTDILWLGGIPAFCMLAFTLLGLNIQVPSAVAGALQHFAAGVLLSAVATELLPTLTAAKGFDENLGLTIGFIAGMGTLILLGKILPEEDESDNHKHDNHHREIHEPLPVVNPAFASWRQKAHSLRQRGYGVQRKYMKGALQKQGASDGELLPVANEEQSLLRSASAQSSTHSSVATASSASSSYFPSVFLAAVIVDSCMDGLLIGIASAAGPSAGPMMAASLSVEMSFLGLTLATALHGFPYAKSIPASVAGPAALLGSAILGGILSSALKEEKALFAGLMGFGTSALLFMVAEELLLEAHEDGVEHIWWVDVQLYTGFYVSFMSSKFIPD